MQWDEDKAAHRTRIMWIRLGRAYEKSAIELVEGGLHHRALTSARIADCCFWQASGVMDPISMPPWPETT